jgi:hypothetical protein
MGEDVERSAEAGALRVPLTPFGAVGDIQATGERLGEGLVSHLPEGFQRWVRETRESLPKRQDWLGRLARTPGIGVTGAPTTLDIARGVEARSGGRYPAGYVGQTFPGRLAGAATEVALNPVNLAAGPGGIGERFVQGLAAGAGGEAGSEAFGPIGGFLGGGLGSLLRQSAIARTAQRAANLENQPTAAQVRMAGSVGSTGRANAAADLGAANFADSLDQAIDRSARDAQAGGGNVARGLRTRLNRMINESQDARERGDTRGVLPPEYERGLRKIVSSDDMLRKFTDHWHHGHGLAALWALGTGHWAALPAIGVSMAARGVPRFFANRRVVSQARRLRDEALRSAPSGPGPATMPLWPNPNQIPGAALRGSLSDLATQQQQ